MRVLLALHGYPPELVGGTEGCARNLARGLVARGHEVRVVAGSMQHGPDLERTEETQDDGVHVVRLHRPDLFFDHWQKSFSPEIAARFEAEVRAFRPDVVHVHHWIRMTRDLVAIAARAGVPAAVTLHDYWPSCLVTFRVRPDTQEACDVPLAPDPCLRCAALVPPRTPWVDVGQQMIALMQHKDDLARELKLARAVLAPTRSHAEHVSRFLGLEAEGLAVHVVPNGRDLALTAPERAMRDDGRLVLATWGNLHPLKGVDLVLEAVARLADPRRVRLHVAGNPVSAEYAERLHAIQREHDLDVTFHGGYDVAALDTHPLAEADAMVSGSRARESFGLVLDEARAMEMAMILPRSGAFPERLEEGRGARFYAPGDVADLARVLAELLDAPEDLAALRAGLPPRETLTPGLDAHVERVLEIYGDVRAAGAPAVAQREWFELRMAGEAVREWDRRLSAATPEELGFA